MTALLAAIALLGLFVWALPRAEQFFRYASPHAQTMLCGLAGGAVVTLIYLLGGC